MSYPTTQSQIDAMNKKIEQLNIQIQMLNTFIIFFSIGVLLILLI